MNIISFEQVTGLSAAKGITRPSRANKALIQTESQPVRWRDDGTDPTAAIGMRLLVGETLVYSVDDFSKIKFIEEAASAKLNISYYYE